MAGPLRARADSGGWRHIGEVGAGVVRETGLRTIAAHLERAGGSGGRAAAAAFTEAAGIRHQLRRFREWVIRRRPGNRNGDAPG